MRHLVADVHLLAQAPAYCLPVSPPAAVRNDSGDPDFHAAAVGTPISPDQAVLADRDRRHVVQVEHPGPGAEQRAAIPGAPANADAPSEEPGRLYPPGDRLGLRMLLKQSHERPGRRDLPVRDREPAATFARTGRRTLPGARGHNVGGQPDADRPP